MKCNIFAGALDDEAKELERLLADIDIEAGKRR